MKKITKRYIKEWVSGYKAENEFEKGFIEALVTVLRLEKPDEKVEDILEKL